MGYYDRDSLSRFLSQYYHTDHGKVDNRCLVVGEVYPPSYIISLIEDPRYEYLLNYLQGSFTDEQTFYNANIRLAVSVFILTD